MKFRKLLLALRLWRRSRRARRECLRLRKQIIEIANSYDSEKKALIQHYETQLALERTRNESLHTSWADRFLQLQKISSLGVTTSLIEERAALKLPKELKPEVSDEDSLSPNQFLELQERKQLFFQQGLQLEKSPSEINNRWNDVKDQIVADIRMISN